MVTNVHAWETFVGVAPSGARASSKHVSFMKPNPLITCCCTLTLTQPSRAELTHAAVYGDDGRYLGNTALKNSTEDQRLKCETITDTGSARSLCTYFYMVRTRYQYTCWEYWYCSNRLRCCESLASLRLPRPASGTRSCSWISGPGQRNHGRL